MRRSVLAVVLSVAIHAGAGATLLGVGLWNGLSLKSPVEFELVSVTTEVKDLPLGPPPMPAQAGQAPRPRKPRVHVATAGSLKAPSPDAGAPDATAPTAGTGDAGAREVGNSDAGRPRPGDLRQYGPEGSRLTALLRLDRLRASPRAASYIPVVDALLQRLPDRLHLIEGSGLDLYRDFDALLVATPNPLDQAVTFLAARHHLTDANLQKALEKGGAAVGRPITWTRQGDRPVAARKISKHGPNDPVVIPDRDDRIIVLPQAGLAVMAPPAYARLLLGGAGGPDWTQLVARIDAEDGAMPAEAVLVMTAANLMRGKPGAGGDGPGRVVPPTRGVVDDDGTAGLAGTGNGGLPDVASVVVAIDPAPSVEITAVFADEAAARGWETRWPDIKRKALTNPLLLLGGMVPIVVRAELTREGKTITLRTTATNDETLRLLQMAAGLLGGKF